MFKRIKKIIGRYKLPLAIILGGIYYFIAAKFLYTYIFDIWDQQTWGYTAILESPFVVYAKNLGPSGTSVYPPLANFYIDIEAFLSALWDSHVLGKTISLTTLSPSYKVIRKFLTGLIHFLFSIFAYKKIFKNKSLKNGKKEFIGFLILILNPVSLLVGTVWGQLDEIMILLILLCLYFLSKRKLVVSSVLFAAAFLFKIPAIIILPIYLFGLVAITFVRNKRTINRKFLCKFYTKLSISGFTFLSIFIIVSLPFFLYDSTAYFRIYTNLRIFPFVNMNGFNIWMYLFGSRNPVTDDGLFIGNLSHHTIGVASFAIISLNILFVFLKKFIKNNLNLSYSLLVEFSYLIYGTFFIFMTEVHERYIIYMYLPYLLLFIFEFLKRKLFIWEYILLAIFTVLSSSNLLYVLYRQEFLDAFGKINVDFAVRTLSAFIVYFYLITLIVFSRKYNRRES